MMKFGPVFPSSNRLAAPGDTITVNCPAGQVWSWKKRACVKCNPGEVWSEKEGACVSCPEGFSWSEDKAACVSSDARKRYRIPEPGKKSAPVFEETKEREETLQTVAKGAGLSMTAKAGIAVVILGAAVGGYFLLRPKKNPEVWRAKKQGGY